MGLTRKQKYGILGRLPFIGKYIRMQVDKATLKELLFIEKQFASSTVRFDTLIHDLYDCLKDLERPLAVDPIKFHNYQLLVHTRSSKTISVYLERVYGNENLNFDVYFGLYVNSRDVGFLDWFSNEESLEKFTDQMLGLLMLSCVRFKCDGYETLNAPESNPELERLVSSRWLKLLVMDHIQVLVTILTERTGG
jgi:hypothetical protein